MTEKNADEIARALGLTKKAILRIKELLQLLLEENQPDLQKLMNEFEGINSQFSVSRIRLKQYLKNERERYRIVAEEIIKSVWEKSNDEDFLKQPPRKIRRSSLPDKVKLTIMLLATRSLNGEIDKDTCQKIFELFRGTKYSYYDLTCYCITEVLEDALSRFADNAVESQALIQRLLENLLWLANLSPDFFQSYLEEKSFASNEDVIWQNDFCIYKITAARFLFHAYFFFAYKQYWQILRENLNLVSPFCKFNEKFLTRFRKKLEEHLDPFIDGLLNFETPEAYLSEFHVFHLYPLHGIHRGAFISKYEKFHEKDHFFKAITLKDWEIIFRLFDYTYLTVARLIDQVSNLLECLKTIETTRNDVIEPLERDLNTSMENTIALIGYFYDNYFDHFDLFHKKTYSDFFRTSMLKVVNQMTQLIDKFNSKIKIVSLGNSNVESYSEKTSLLKAVQACWDEFYNEYLDGMISKLKLQSISMYHNVLYRRTRIEAFKLWNTTARISLNRTKQESRLTYDSFASIEYIADHFIPNLADIELPVLINVLNVYLKKHEETKDVG